MGIIIAVVDTRDESHIFIYHYIDESGNYKYTNSIEQLEKNKNILKIAYTGNHYLSIEAHPSLYALHAKNINLTAIAGEKNDVSAPIYQAVNQAFLQYITMNNSNNKTEIPQKLNKYHGDCPLLNIETFVFRPYWREEIDKKFSSSPKEALAQAIQSALVGMSGNGKTKLALQYFFNLKDIKNEEGHLQAYYEEKDRYTLRIWIQADNSTILNENLLKLAVRLKDIIHIYKKDTDEEKLQKLVQWLESNPGWLLVLDNADQNISFEHIPKYGGHILITSQYPHWQGAISIPTMKEEESTALTLFKKIVGIEDARVSEQFLDEMKGLMNDIGYLPLAIAGLGIFLKQYCDSVAACRKRYSDNMKQFLSNHQLPANDKHLPITLAFGLILEKLQKSENPHEKFALALLNYCVYLDTNRLSYKIIEQLMRSASLNHSFQLLLNHSILEINPHTETIYIHPIVQEVVKEYFQGEKALRTKSAILLAFLTGISIIYDECNQKTEKIRWTRELVFHMLALEKNIPPTIFYADPKNKFQFAKKILKLYFCIAEAYELFANLAKVKEYLMKTIEFIKLLSPFDNYENDLANAIKKLANVYMQQKKFFMQKELLINLLQRQKILFGPLSYEVAATLIKLAFASKELEEFESCEEYLKNASEVSEKLSVEDDKKILSKGIDMVRRKLFFQEMSKIEGVNVITEWSFNPLDLFSPIFESTLQTAYNKNKNNLDACQDLANQSFRRKKFPKAIIYYLKALEIDKNSIYSRSYLSRCYQFLGNSKKAEENILEIQSVYPSHSGICAEYGMLLWRESRFDEAISIFQKTLTLSADNIQLSFVLVEKDWMEANLGNLLKENNGFNLEISTRWLAYYMLIVCYFATLQEKQIPEILEKFVESVEAKKISLGFKLLFYINEHMGNQEKARKYENKILSLETISRPLLKVEKSPSAQDIQSTKDSSLLKMIVLEDSSNSLSTVREKMSHNAYLSSLKQSKNISHFNRSNYTEFIKNSPLIDGLNQQTKLKFYGVCDEKYKVDAIVKVATETDRAAASELQQSLNGYGRFFKFDDEKEGFILEGINLPSDEVKESVGSLIKKYLNKQR